MFLNLLDQMKFNFIKTNHYLNVGKYLYFFTTENIKDKEKLYDYFRDCLSIPVTCYTATKLKDNRISFYFGIKGKELEYGFHDDMKREVYKTGLFEINDRYLRSLKSYKCLTLISGALKNSNIKNLNFLHEVKLHLKKWYDGKGSVVILNEYMVRKSVDKEFLKEEIKDPVVMLRKYEIWCERFRWIDKVYYYIDTEDDDYVNFYIKIKTKKEEEY